MKLRGLGSVCVPAITLLAWASTPLAAEADTAAGAPAPLKVFLLAGQSNRQGKARTFTFEYMKMDPVTVPILEKMVDAEGNPRVINGVWISTQGCAREGEKFGPLTAGMLLPEPAESDADGRPGGPIMCVDSAPDQQAPFPGTKSLFGEKFDLYRDNGHIVVVPKQAAKGKPWVWRARFWGHEPQFDLAMLDRGYHVVYCNVAGLLGNPEAVKRWDAYYAWLTGEHGFAKKAVLEGMSRGGMIIYNWAIANPDKVAAIYGDAPVMDLKSWPGFKSGMVHRAYDFPDEDAFKAYKGNPVDNLAPLAKAGIPIIHVVGDKDTTVPVAENTAIAEQRYKALGGVMEVIHKPDTGHHPHSLKDPAPIVDFILQHTGDTPAG